MNNREIANQRLVNQQLIAPRFANIVDLVGWMGAIQAQDHPMAHWAIGLCLPNSTHTTVQTAFDAGEILRTHVLRPTWHIIANADLRWMLQLTAATIKKRVRTSIKHLHLDEATFAHSNRVIEQAFKDAEFLKRDDLVAALNNAGIVTMKIALAICWKTPNLMGFCVAVR